MISREDRDKKISRKWGGVSTRWDAKKRVALRILRQLVADW